MQSVHGTHTPELLAPAGGPDALRAAVNNGADAVYLGMGELNARRGAENFTAETLAEATRYAHIRGVRVYLTANVIIRPDEMEEALGLVDTAWVAGVDAVILQDLGLARAVRATMPHVRIHASTQLNAHNTDTVRELAALGFYRVTLARELSVQQITDICGAVDVEVESFVHGAICLSYSGQCLLSSVVGGRSANRGACAQPCRLPYELLDETGRELRSPGRYLMSPKDLAGITHLPRLIEAGVSALKIEGRMKSPEYVAVVTGIYRAALDRAIADPESFSVSDAELDMLAEVFSRGFTAGYLDGTSDDSIMSFNRPNNRGVAVARVAERGEEGALLALDRAVELGDTLEFWTARGRFAQKVTALSVDGRAVTVAPAGAHTRIRAERPVRDGDRVFRVVSAALEAAARRTFVGDDGGRVIPARIGAKIIVGEPLEVRIEAAGKVASAKGPVVEPARTKALTAAEVIEHVGRLGSTALRPEGYDIDLDPEAGAGFSVLHRIRREAVEALEASILKPYTARESVTPSTPEPRRVSRRKRRAERDMPDLVVWTTRPKVAAACLLAGAHRAIVPAWAFGEEEASADLTIELPRIARDAQVTCALETIAPRGRDAVVGNLGMIREVGQIAGETWAHWGLNAANPLSVEALAEMGADGVWLSPEISGRDISRIADEVTAPVGVAVLGRQEVMVTEHCLMASGVSCSKKCGTCPHRERWYALKDRKGYGFPVISDAAGRSHVFNAVPLDLTRALPEIVAAGVAAVRYDITVEHHQEAQHLTRRLREALQAAVSGRDADDDMLIKEGTAGHFFRGVR